MAYDAEIQSLLNGYQLFLDGVYQEEAAIYEELAKNGQQPSTLVVTCCDSRLSPEKLFQVRPGELFVVRNVANLVPPFEGDQRHHGTSAALEFAVKSLEVSNIVLLGHSQCGGIRALVEQNPEHARKTDFIEAWMDTAQSAKRRVQEAYPDASVDEQAQLCERESLLLSKANLMTFPWIRERVKDGKLTLHAWHIDIRSKEISGYDEAQDAFLPLEPVS